MSRQKHYLFCGLCRTLVASHCTHSFQISHYRSLLSWHGVWVHITLNQISLIQQLDPNSLKSKSFSVITNLTCILSAHTNLLTTYFSHQSIRWLFPWSIDYLFGQKMVKHVDLCFPELTMMSYMSCPQSKDIEFTFIEEVKTWYIFTFKSWKKATLIKKQTNSEYVRIFDD